MRINGLKAAANLPGIHFMVWLTFAIVILCICQIVLAVRMWIIIYKKAR